MGVTFVFAFLVSLVALVIADLLWVGVVFNQYYHTYLDHLRGPIQWGGAVGFYLVYALGITAFVVVPYQGQLLQIFLYGMLLGLVVYGVYNFTNHATLLQWPWHVVVVDIIWGVVMTGVVAVVAGWVIKFLQ